MNSTNKKRYTSNYAYNAQPNRKKLIMAAPSDCFGFDCVNLSNIGQFSRNTILKRSRENGENLTK